MNITWRFAAAYLLLGLVLAGITAGTVAGLFLPRPAKHQVTKKDLGVSDLVLLAKKAVSASAAAQGVVILGYKRADVKCKTDTECAVTLVVSTDLGRVVVRVGFSKSVWSVTGMEAA